MYQHHIIQNPTTKKEEDLDQNHKDKIDMNNKAKVIYFC